MSAWLSSSLSSALHHLAGSQGTITTVGQDSQPDAELSPGSNQPLPTLKTDSERSATASHASPFRSPDTSHKTPEQARPSPRTRASLSGSTVLSGILESHPAFSVFRKSTSLQSISSLSSSNADEFGTAARTTSAKQHDDFAPAGSNSDVSDEWHLSSVEEMESLNWGDRSGDTSSAADDSRERGRHNNDDRSAVRLVQYDSPPSRRASTSKSPRPSTQVQFSPLSLAPSPLIGVPRPPPPQPALDSGNDDSPSSRAVVRTILKVPRTPGTGQSVRFSCSTRETTPPSLARFADAGEDEAADELEPELSFDDNGDSSTSSGGSSKAVASFLSKLQAAIPSPETSLVEQHAPEAETSSVTLASHGPNPLLLVSSPTASEFAPKDHACIGLGRPPMFAEDESNLFDTSAPHFSRVQSVEDWSVADATEEEPESTSDQATTPDVGESSSDGSPAAPSPSPAPKSLATSPLATSQLASSSSSASQASTPSSPSNTSTVSNTTLTPERSVSNRRSSTSFYRQFLKKRASESQMAADELGRLIEREGEKTPSPRAPAPADSPATYTTPVTSYAPTSPGSLKRSARDMDNEDEDSEAFTGSTSIYFSPGASERSFSVAAPSPATQSVFTEVLDDDVDIDSSAERVEASLLSELGGEHLGVRHEQDEFGGYSPSQLLPAIYEESEPNTTVDSISLQSPPTVIPFGSNPHRRSMSHPLSPAETDLSIFHSTPAPPPRHRRTQSEACAPSPNPFTTQGGNNDGLDLIHQLISAQGDQLANGSSQRFLLSSLITNLRDEIERKDSVLRSLQEQKEEAESFSKIAFKEAAEWERAARNGALADPSRAKLEALEDLVERLTDELETRTALDERSRKKLEDECGILRVDVQAARSDVRDGEIRLRHARASQSEAEAMRSRVERERDELREHLSTAVGDAQQYLRERDDLRARLRRELEDRDATIVSLRAELAERPEAGEMGQRLSAGDSEIERRIEEARAAAIREAAVVQADLEAQVQHARAQAEAVVDLRHQNRGLREELSLIKDAERQKNSAADVARLEARTELGRLRVELSEANRTRKALIEDLDELHGRIESIQMDKDRQLEAMQRELEKHRGAWQESRGAQDQLLDTIATIEADATKQHTALQTAHDDLEALRRETNALLDDRDRRIADSQTSLASKRAKMDVLVEECTRLKELVGALRRGSNERDDKITRLQKAKAELQEDIMGLNIALESKQQEAALWKRQAATASRIPTPSQRPRSALGSSVASNNSSRVSYQAPAHSDTPIKARPKPKLAFGSSAVHRSLDIDDTPSKENVRPPARQRASSGDSLGAATKQRRMLAPA